MPKATVGFVVSISSDVRGGPWVTARLRKQVWTVETGSRSRTVAETTFHRGTSSERELIADALRELLLALEDRLS